MLFYAADGCHSRLWVGAVFFMPKILLIAPRSTGLVVEDEVQDILRSGLTVTPILGNVTRQDIYDEPGEYDILWIAAHGGADGVQLTDQLWPTDDLIDYARDFRLVVLNTCHSLEMAQGIRNRWGVGVVCTVSEVGDRDAGRVAARFARELAATGNVEQAYEHAKRGANKTYLYVGGRYMLDSNKLSEEIRTELAEIKLILSRDLSLLSSRVWLLERITVALGIITGGLILLQSWLFLYVWLKGFGA